MALVGNILLQFFRPSAIAQLELECNDLKEQLQSQLPQLLEGILNEIDSICDQCCIDQSERPVTITLRRDQRYPNEMLLMRYENKLTQLKSWAHRSDPLRSLIRQHEV